MGSPRSGNPSTALASHTLLAVEQHGSLQQLERLNHPRGLIGVRKLRRPNRHDLIKPRPHHVEPTPGLSLRFRNGTSEVETWMGFVELHTLVFQEFSTK